MYVGIVVCVWVLCRARSYETNSSQVLVESLRRQLMYDNYDYQPSSDTEEELTRRGDVEPKVDITLESFNIFEPKADEQHGDSSHQGRDNLYLLTPLEATLTPRRHDLYSDYDTTTTHKPKPKYKILKIKKLNRRSMGTRKFIQEETDDGVAIFSLDDGPFPEFRLPKSRRQYMQDADDLDELEPDLNFTADTNRTKPIETDVIDDIVFNSTDINKV